MDFFSLWKAHNEAIHGHSLSSQQQAHWWKIHIEMEILHSQHDQVLSYNTTLVIYLETIYPIQYWICKRALNSRYQPYI
jgi:hypothetical protein